MLLIPFLALVTIVLIPLDIGPVWHTASAASTPALLVRSASTQLAQKAFDRPQEK